MTVFVKRLFGEFYTSMKGDLHDKDTRIKLQGSWGVELEEMVSQNKADIDAMKAFLSATMDHERAAYGRSAEKVQRSYVLFGTTNDLQLKDPTGHRRFVCVQVGQIDFMRVTELRDQVWAEADRLARDGFEHHLDANEKAFIREQAEDHVADNPLVDKLRDVLTGVPFVTMQEAYRAVMGDKAERVIPQRDAPTWRRALLEAKFEPKRLGGNGGCKGWIAPDDVAAALLKPNTKLWLDDPRAEEVRKQLRGAS